MKVTIDGGASTGKSTVAKLVAKELDIVLINTGAFYRYLTAVLIKTGLNKDLDSLEARHLIGTLDLTYETNGTLLSTKFGDLSDEIFMREVTDNVSEVAEQPYIRNKVTNILRMIVATNPIMRRGFIMEGRDIGSVVFPDAKYKFYLTVSDEEAAKRRFKEFQQKSVEVTFEEVLDNIKKRNEIDSNRKEAPLVKPKGAIELKTDNQSPEEVAKTIYTYVKKNEK